MSGRLSRFASIALLTLIMAALAVIMTPAARAAAVKAVSVEKAGTGLSVTIAFDAAFETPESFALSGPERLVIDLPGGRASGETFPGEGVVRQIRTAQFDNHTARIVLDLDAPARIAETRAEGRTLTLNLDTGASVDFATLVRAGRTPLPGTQQTKVAKTESAPAAVSPAKQVASAPAPKPKPPSAKRARHAPPARSQTGLPVVVIDAGHGGRDPGSPSINGKHEKDAVLAIAKAIKSELDDSGRVRTILTRSDDRYIPHRERTDIARRNRAQLFISVHADSFPQEPTVSGATIYTLSETASDKEAARLASRENRSDLIAGVDMTAENDDVTSILIDLAQRETMNSSAEFAALLQREMVGAGVPFRSHFHRFAGFLVLKAPDVPAVLLETGYMSNAKDSAYLFSEAGQKEIAEGVRRAVEAHFLRKLARR